MYDALLIARYVIMRCNNLNVTISNLKLQKILYFIQAEFLVVKQDVCFPNKIEAWEFGPVVPDVYHKYKIFGSASIHYVGSNSFAGISSDDRALIDGIIDECAGYSASTLVEITHNQTPWKDAFRPRCNCVITPQSIHDYFSEG